MPLTDLLLIAYSTYFLVLFTTTCRRDGISHGDLGPPISNISKEIDHQTCLKQSDGGICQLSSLISDNSTSGHVNNKTKRPTRDLCEQAGRRFGQDYTGMFAPHTCSRFFFSVQPQVFVPGWSLDLRQLIYKKKSITINGVLI